MTLVLRNLKWYPFPMPSVHADAVERVVEELLNGDETGRIWRWLQKLRKDLTAGEYGWMARVVGQKQPRAVWTIYEAYAYGLVHFKVCTGTVFVAEIEVGDEPSSDSEVQENNAKLRKIAKPFKANFVGGHKSDDDGDLEWDAEIEIAQVMVKGLRGKKECLVMKAQPGSAPLEVGTTEASRTNFHLSQYKRLARWPYGSDTVYLLMEQV